MYCKAYGMGAKYLTIGINHGVSQYTVRRYRYLFAKALNSVPTSRAGKVAGHLGTHTGKLAGHLFRHIGTKVGRLDRRTDSLADRLFKRAGDLEDEEYGVQV
jgi:hypothetical protein